jgi:GTP diphosphokinase / guanosine-3',5'-bis(diphosphate) 3'-diphosphatase
MSDLPTLQHLERFSASDKARITHALEFATRKHAPQRRVSGEPFITHPIAVAQLLVDEFNADTDTVMAGLLHDTVEDTGTGLEEIEQEFGAVIKFLVDALTDVGKGDGHAAVPERSERDMLTHAKVDAYAAKDPRVYLVKIADRWHNMLRCEALRPKNQKRLANETLRYHVPIARRIGFEGQAVQLQHASEAVLARVERIEASAGARREYLR